MRGQPDLLFWRIDTQNLDKKSDAQGSGRDDEKGDNGDNCEVDNNKNNNIDGNNDHNEGNNDRYKYDDSKSNNKNDNSGSNYDDRSKKNIRTNTNIDIITTHTVFAVEVKSSTDQLSEWQIAWFNLLNHAGFHVENFQVLDA